MSFINNLKDYKVELTEDELVQGKQGLDIKKLIGFNNTTYRLRVADYRIIYEVYDKQIIIKVIKIAHRKEVYRGEQ